MGPENWPNRFPGAADSADPRTTLRNTALDLSGLASFSSSDVLCSRHCCRPAPCPPLLPLGHSPGVFSEHHSWCLDEPWHRANPRGPTRPWVREWFKVSMDPFLICGKGSFNLPLDVQVGRHEAVRPSALLYRWGELGSSWGQQNRQVKGPGCLMLMLLCWVNQPRTTLSHGFSLGDRMHSLLFELVESGFFLLLEADNI